MGRIRRYVPPAPRPYGWRRLLADVGLAVAILVVGALIALRLDPADMVSRSGRAVVGDGDTITIAGERIRLRGIDAPELDQTCTADGSAYPCGLRAKEALRTLVGEGAVTCVGTSRDRYGRLLAICRAGKVELNRTLVAEGWAVAFGGYGDEEAEARAAGRGLWAGEFQAPQMWRRARGSMDEGLHDGIDAVIDRLLGYLRFT